MIDSIIMTGVIQLECPCGEDSIHEYALPWPVELPCTCPECGVTHLFHTPPDLREPHYDA